MVDAAASASAHGGRRMSRIDGSARSSSPAGPARSVPPWSTSCSTPAPPTSTCSTTSSAAAEPTSTTPSPPGAVELVEGDIRDRDAGPRPHAGADLVFHQAAIRITQCAEEPAARARGARRRHVQRPRGGRRAPGRQAGRRLVGLGLRHGQGVPDASATTPTRTTPLRRRQGRSTRACCAASAPCTAWTTSPLRYFNVYGPRMDVHGLYTEVLDPLDGADRRRASRR